MKMQNHDDRERPIGSDGLTVKEREVLRLADAGVAVDEIARRTALNPERVGAIRRNYADNGADPWKDAARQGSDLLARAINRMFARQQPERS